MPLPPRAALHDTIEALATHNRAPELGGITREVYTPEYAEGLELVAAYMTERGLQTRIDPAGNLIGRLAGTDPALPRVITGSHVDTTLNAGKYDGVVGVLGGADAAARVAAGGQPRRTIEVIAFAGEEPRFGIGCIGSRLMAGNLPREALDSSRDRDGVSIAEALRAAGHDPDLALQARAELQQIHAIVELHVEQGGRLEAEGMALGVVTRIAAAHQLRVTVTGTAVHSGATPMGLRHDALVAAAEVTIALERIAAGAASGTAVGTIGILEVSPGAVNVVPGEVTFVADIRDSDADCRAEVVAAFRAAVEATCTRRGCTVRFEVTQDNAPSACDQQVVEAVRAGCRATGRPWLEMQSGAYHDCMSFAPTVPIGMLFVPSAGGISHHPDEYTAPEEIDRGVDALAEALRRLAN